MSRKGKTCIVEGCERAQYAKDMCCAHRARVLKTGNAGPPQIGHRERRDGAARCIVEGCGRLQRRAGYCGRHSHKHYRYGNAQEADRRTKPKKKCAVEECGRDAKCKGYCKTHDRQIARYGKITQRVIRKIAPFGTGSVTPDGYITIGGELQHRLVAERHLGRKLRSEENVHHRNGVRSDNSIGPCFLKRGCECSTFHNLELWARVQPSGSRVADLLSFAHDIIRRYDEGGESAWLFDVKMSNGANTKPA